MNDDNINAIAVIGMAGRFPGAGNVDEFWGNLIEGQESIAFYSDEELEQAGIERETIEHPDYVKAKGELEGTDLFDASFFGINPREAEVTDPQHRLLLECAWEAMEHAGYDSGKYDGLIGVYAGKSMDFYLLLNVYPNVRKQISAGYLQAAIGNDKDSLTTTISYRLNLTGPGITVQTSSSTSLVSVCVACQSLLTYQCDIALAGGITAGPPIRSGYLYESEGIWAHDGHTRAFDAEGRGFVHASGMGIAVLKRLEDALDDGDTIWAIIKGFAVNNDGSKKVSYSAPSVDGQAHVIAQALAMADVHPETIQYIESHGTATRLGDPIEMAGLIQAFSAGTDKKQYCAIGSVKTNIGHIDTAAGIASLIKAALALKNKTIPASLNFEKPNPRIDFENSPFYVNRELKEWKTNGAPRRAGVTSIGMGGTNAHVILEEWPDGPSHGAQQDREHRLILLSAKTETALDQMTINLTEYLKKNPQIDLADAAYTLKIGRRDFNRRRMVLCKDIEDAVSHLENKTAGKVIDSVCGEFTSPVIFMFTGAGSQYVDMGKELYLHEKVFKENIDKCAEFLAPLLDLDLREVLYPSLTPLETLNITTKNARRATKSFAGVQGDSRRVFQKSPLPAGGIDQTWLTHPVLFMLEYSLARLWMEWGIEPAGLIGHGIGELVAACISGCFSLEDALRLVAVRVEENDLAEFSEALAKAELNAPGIPFISGVTGTWIKNDEAQDRNYWLEQLRQPVRFSAGIEEILENPSRVLLEIGPGNALCALAQQHRQGQSRKAIFSSIRNAGQKEPDSTFLRETLGKLWLSGVSIDWGSYYREEKRRRIPLPTYPFERKRFWLEPGEEILPETRKTRKKEPPPQEVKSEPEESAQKRPELKTKYVAPTNDTERKIVDLWEEILGIKPIGIEDNFFELGGHSLLATLFLSRLQEEMGIRLEMKTIFEETTVATVAVHVAAGKNREKEGKKYDAVVPVEKKEYYVLSSAQKRFYMLQHFDAQSRAYNMTGLIEAAGKLEKQRFETTWKKIIQRHETLRTSIITIDGQPRQRIHREVEFEIEYYDAGPGEEIIKNFIRPFDLREAPLLRVGLIKLEEEKHILMFDMHHIISDGMSLSLLTKNFIAFYPGGELPLSMVRYRDYCEWQDHLLTTGKLKEEENFWLDYFSGDLPVLNMPLDFPRPAAQSFAGDIVYFQFEEELSRKVKQLTDDTGATLYMVLLAFYTVTLSKYSRQGDIVIGSPIAVGRTHGGLENTIGLLIETIAVRNFPAAGKTFAQFLGEVKENTLRAFENQAYPFRELLKKVGDEDNRSRNPLFAAMLIVQNIAFGFQGAEIGSLRLRPYEGVPHDISQVDLTLEAEERESGIFFNLEYCTKLFKRETMEKFIAVFKEIVTAVIENREMELGDIRVSYDLISAESDAYGEEASTFDF